MQERVCVPCVLQHRTVQAMGALIFVPLDHIHILVFQNVGSVEPGTIALVAAMHTYVQRACTQELALLRAHCVRWDLIVPVLMDLLMFADRERMV